MASIIVLGVFVAYLTGGGVEFLSDTVKRGCFLFIIKVG